jgi:hypothetical protein
MFEAAMRFGERRRCGSDQARCWQRQISLMLIAALPTRCAPPASVSESSKARFKV